MQNGWSIVKRTLVAFYDDQMTHHAAALTYYGLMSLFPAVLLALSLLGLLGQYPETYDAIIGYLREVAPDSVRDPLDWSLEQALQNKGTAATALVISVADRVLRHDRGARGGRRALNVVFEVDGGRSFFRRKLDRRRLDDRAARARPRDGDPRLRRRRLRGGPARLHRARAGGCGRLELRPLAGGAAEGDARLLVHLLHHPRRRAAGVALGHAGRGRRRAAVARRLVGLLDYISSVADVGAVYGAFAGAIVLVGWIWLTNVALLFGAELNAEIERERELREGIPPRETLNRPARQA